MVMATKLSSQDFLDYAKCPYCEHSTPIRQSNFSLSGEYQKWTETDGVPEFFLCNECKRIVGFPAEGLMPRSSSDGLWPTREDAPLQLFELPIGCGAEGCTTRATLYVVWNRTIDDGPNAKTSKKWILADFVCPRGHRFQLPWQ